MSKEYITAKELSEKLGLSIVVIRNLLYKHDFDRNTKIARSPIIKNKRNKNLLLNDLQQCLLNSHYCDLFISRFKHAIVVLKRGRWNA